MSERSSSELIIIRQQPELARMIGFQNTASYLYPQLILQIKEPPDGLKNFQESLFTCHIQLVDSTGINDRSVVKRPPRKNIIARNGVPDSDCDYYQNLEGTKAVSSIFLFDPIDNKKKHFIVFPDLRIRIKGIYRLKCTVFDLASCTITDSFKVYAVNSFPGVSNPTPLTRSLSFQGAPSVGRMLNK